MTTFKNLSVFYLAVLLGLLSVISSGCMFIEGVDGNGKVRKETREVTSFNKIDIGGAFEVYLKQGDNESLVIEADENLLELITTQVSGKTLKVCTEKNIRKSKKLNLYITFTDLENIDVSGAVEVKSQNTLKFDNLKIEGSGASDVELELIVDKLEGDFSGASEIELSGSADEFYLDMSGAGELDAYDFEANNVTLDISGAGSARIYAKENLKVRASGAASVKYKGNPRVDSRISGASSVKKY